MARPKKLITKIKDANYEHEVIISPKPYILLLSAPFSDPEGRMEKVLAEIAEEYEDVVKAGILNIMQERELTEMFEISTAPTLILMTGGVVDIRLPGYPEKEEILRVMELDKIREYRQRGFNYHPPRNFVPGREMESDEEESDGESR